jgi:hypothetical protein
MRLANQDRLNFAHSQEAMGRIERKLKYIKHQWKGSTLFIQMIDGVCPLCFADVKGNHSHQINETDLQKFVQEEREIEHRATH